MKAGEVANGKKFDKGLHEVQDAYANHGHIAVRMDPIPEFDDAGKNVTFKIAVNEGPQYHMGAVEFKGFSADDAFILNKRWKLKSGDVYDRSYVSRFFRDEAREIMTRISQQRQSQGKPLPMPSSWENPDRQALIVNLTIELKN
jgi:outer membrane translocation and assembly module TamA